jgi:hypothetical protein
MVEQYVRLTTLVKEKKNALEMACSTKMIPSNQPLEILALIPIEHEISERVMTQLWDYYEKRPQLNFSDGMQTRMILKSVFFAGMFSAYEYTNKNGIVNANSIINTLAKPDISEIIVNVQEKLRIGDIEGLFLLGRIEPISEKIFNSIYAAYNVRTQSDYNAENHLLVFKDTMTIMFCLGMTYASNRMKGLISKITEDDAWARIKL